MPSAVRRPPSRPRRPLPRRVHVLRRDATTPEPTSRARAPAPAGISASLTPADTPTCLPEGTATVTTGPQDDPTLVSFTGAGSRACSWHRRTRATRASGRRSSHGSRGRATWSRPSAGRTDGVASFIGAVDVLRSLGATDVALVGASKGGTYAAALADDVGAVSVVALGPPAVFDGQDAQSASSSYTGPLLVIASTDDSSVGVDSSKDVSRADDPSTFLELSGDVARGGPARLRAPRRR